MDVIFIQFVYSTIDMLKPHVFQVKQYQNFLSHKKVCKVWRPLSRGKTKQGAGNREIVEEL